MMGFTAIALGLRLTKASVLIVAAAIVAGSTSASAQVNVVRAEAYTVFSAVRSDPVDDHYLEGFLTWQAGAGGISWDRDAPTEASASVDHKAGLGSGGHDDFTSGPVPRDVWINVTRMVQVVGVGGTFHVEILLDGARIAGAPFIHVVQHAEGASTLDEPRLQSEADLLPKGSVLTVRFHYTSKETGTQYTFAGSERLRLLVPEFSDIDRLSRIPGSAQGEEGTDGPSSTVLGGVTAAGLPGIALAGMALGPRRRRTPIPLVALLLFCAALSGCAGAPRSGSVSEPPAVVAGSASATIVAGVSGGNSTTGDVIGTVHDPTKVPVSDAFVAIVGLSNATRTDALGRFMFRQLPVGNHVLRVDHPMFRSFEGWVTIMARQVTNVGIELIPLVADEARPHRHDTWPETGDKILVDQDLWFPSAEGRPTLCAPSNVLSASFDPADVPQGYCRLWFDAPELDEQGLPNLVLPGTYALEVTLDWDSTYTARAGGGEPLFGFVPNNERGFNPGSKNPALNGTVMYPRGKGEALMVRTGWEMGDVGHQAFTTWRFFLLVPEYSLVNGIHVKIEIQKGVVPLEPAHRDFWGGQRSLPVLEDALVELRCTSCSLPGSGWTWKPSSLVPPGTTGLRMVLLQDKPSQPTAHKFWLLYRSADLAPRANNFSSFRSPDLVSEQSGRTEFVHRLDPMEADAFYAQRSNWEFALDDGQDGSVSVANGPIHFRLSVTAEREDGAVARLIMLP